MSVHRLEPGGTSRHDLSRRTARSGPVALALLALLALLCPALASAQAAVELVPIPANVVPGDTVVLEIRVSGLTAFAAPAVGAFDIDLGFDPALFDVQGVEYGPLLGDPVGGEAVTGTTPGVGTLGILEVSLLTAGELLALQPASFVLASVTFESLAQGSGIFDAAVASLGDEEGGPLSVAEVNPVRVTSVDPLDIPTLSTTAALAMVLLLLGAGVLVLGRTS